MTIRAGNVPLSTLNNTDHFLITEGEAPRRVPHDEVKEDFIGSETLTTTAQTVKGAINELDADIGDKTQLPTTDKTNLVNSIKEVNTVLSEKANQNEVINGNLDYWQRGTSLLNQNSVFLADRFFMYNGITGTSPTNITHSRLTLTNEEVRHASYSYRISVDGSGILNSNDTYQLQHPIENGTKKICGLNKKVTISFWGKSNIANKKIGVYLLQKYGSGGTPSASETINGMYFNLTNTWQKFTLTLTTNTLNSKTFGTNNDDCLKIMFLYAYGLGASSQVGDTVAETFGGVGNIDIAQIKLESGDKATPFVPMLPAEELALCQRYYRQDIIRTVCGRTINKFDTVCCSNLDIKMRTTPTSKFFSMYGTTENAISDINGNAISGTFSVSTNTLECTTIQSLNDAVLTLVTNQTVVLLKRDAEIY